MQSTERGKQMIDGITVALPTYNRLEYLKLCLHSIGKYSHLPKTDVSIFVDGSTDGTIEWLEDAGIGFRGRFGNIGAYSAWNNSAKHARNEYIYVAEDDFFFGPDWDVKVARWIEELGPNYVVMPEWVEPIAGSMQEARLDCGSYPENFDEEKFVKFCLQHADRHEVIADPSGCWVLPKDLFFSVGGFDTFYDPMSRGYIDCQLRLCQAHPNLRFVRVWDSMVYHFSYLPGGRNEILLSERFRWSHEKNVKYFEKKYGINVEEAFALIPVGLK